MLNPSSSIRPRVAVLSAPSAPSPDDMISALAVNADGWTLDATILNAKDGGTYFGLNDKVSPGLVLEVSSKSWTAEGVETTLARYVYATSVMRRPHPDGTDLDETESGLDVLVTYSLSNRIFADDTIVGYTTLAAFFTDNGTGGSLATNSGGIGSVTNTSTLAYELPQAVWLTTPDERIDAADWAPKLTVMHRAAQQGTPVRAVAFTATDASLNTVTSTVTNLTTGQYSASGLHANWYEPNWDLSSLTDGEVVTIDAEVFPWVGDSYTLSASGFDETSPNISTLSAVCDAGGTYGTVYAYVDGVGGGTPQASTNPATAAANPFATLYAAAAAAQSINSSTYSRNNTSGVVIRIPASTDIVDFGSNFAIGLNVGDLPVVIEGVDRATSTFETGNGSSQKAIATKMKFKNLTIKRPSGAGGGGIGMQGANAISSYVVFEDVTFDLNGTSPYNAWIYRPGREYFINCDGDHCGQGMVWSPTEAQATALLVGGTFIVPTYNAIANAYQGTITLTPVPTANLGDAKGGIFAWNELRNNHASNKLISIGNLDFGVNGFAAFGNVLESYGSTATAFYFSGDSDVTPITNCIEAMNTVAGERINVGYQDTGTAEVQKDIVSKHSVHWRWNSKSDYFTTASGNRIGNWPLRHGVDGGYLFIDLGSNDGATTPGYDKWLGEGLGDAKDEMPVGTVVTGDPDFADDQSGLSGSGGGSYVPGASTEIPNIPAGETMFAVDLYGTAIPTDGSAFAGAVQ